MRNAHFTGELDQVLWFSGSNEVTVVELSDLRMIEIKNFLPASSTGKETVALRAVMREKAQFIVVAFIVDNNFGLAYQFPGVREPNIYLLTEILPNCRLDLQTVKTLLALENGDPSTRYVFAVGQSQFDTVQKDTSFAIIACLVMTEHLSLVREYKLSNKKYVGATCIRRLRPNANEFVIGVYQGLVIVEFDERQGFREVQYFENIHTRRYLLTPRHRG